jgi:ribose transport system permease protein
VADAETRVPNPPRRNAGTGIRLALSAFQLGPALVLLLLVLIFAWLSPYFFTEVNLKNLLVQASVVGCLAVGQLAVVVTRGIDISQAQVLALATVVGAAVAGPAPGSAFTVISLMLLTGVLVGLLNGVLVVAVIRNPFIITLGMYSLVSGVAFLISDARAQPGMPRAVQTLGGGELWGFPVPALVLLALLGIFWIFTRALTWGRWIYAVGGNEEAARRTGVPVGRVLLSVYAMAGLAAAVGGIITAGRTNSGFPTAGGELLLDAVTAVIIGGASLFGGRGHVVHALIGALILATVRNGLNIVGASAFWQLVAIGCTVILAVTIDAARTRMEGRLRVLAAELAERDAAPDAGAARTVADVPAGRAS